MVTKCMSKKELAHRLGIGSGTLRRWSIRMDLPRIAGMDPEQYQRARLLTPAQASAILSHFLPTPTASADNQAQTASPLRAE